MAKKQPVKKKRSAKKGFYEVHAPLTSARISLYGTGVEELSGKIVKIDLTRSLKGKGFELRLQTKVVGERLEGEPISLRLAGSYVRRSMRKGTDYVEDSFEAECKDVIARVKPFLITRRRVSRAVRKALRNAAKKNLLAYMKSRTGQEIFSEIMANKLQKVLSLKLKKIYPLALCEIRIFEIERKKDKESKSEKKEEGEEAKE